MISLNKFTNKIEGHGGFATILHALQVVSPSSFIIRHSGFDTVPQQQKQRWKRMVVKQRNLYASDERQKHLPGVSKSSSRREIEGKQVCSVRNDS